jgi:hypothetical protein
MKPTLNFIENVDEENRRFDEKRDKIIKPQEVTGNIAKK